LPVDQRHPREALGQRVVARSDHEMSLLAGAPVASPKVSNPKVAMLGFEPADHSLGFVVEDDDDLIRVLFNEVKSQAADREIDDFMIVPRSRPA